ncbi:hypothetical protein ACFCXR_01385 [Streptomyces noursei]
MHGFTVDLAWSAGQATSFTLPNTGPASATPRWHRPRGAGS